MQCDNGSAAPMCVSSPLDGPLLLFNTLDTLLSLSLRSHRAFLSSLHDRTDTSDPCPGHLCGGICGIAECSRDRIRFIRRWISSASPWSKPHLHMSIPNHSLSPIPNCNSS